MDKLKPLLAHKFWILFGLTLLIPLVGWWMTSGAIANEAGKKVEEIKTAEGKVSSLGADSANPRFVEGAKEIVDRKAKIVEEQTRLLWERQQAMMVWPRVMQGSMAQYAYRDDIDDSERIRYVVEYPKEIERIKEILKPYNGLQEGLVSIRATQLPFVDVKKAWGVSPPSPSQMWDAQEDTWLAEAIFRAIAEVNAGESPTIISEAPIRQIQTLVLRGGTRGAEGQQVTGSGDESSGFPSEGEEGGTGGATLNLFSNAGGAVGGGGGDEEGGGGIVGGKTNVAIDPDLVFGPDALASAEGSESEFDGGFLGGPSGGGDNAEKKRYIDDDETQPYKTRGFYIHLTMKIEFVPELMLSLTNMDWPTYIAHTRISEIHPDPVQIVKDEGDFGPGGGDGNFEFEGPGSGGPIGIIPQILPQPMGPLRPSGDTGNRRDLLASALQNPALAEVVIAGVITIYRKPAILEETETDPEGDTGEADPMGEAPMGEPTDGEPTDGQPTDGETPDGETPGETGTDPVDGGMPTDGDPVDGDPVTPPSPDPGMTDPMPETDGTESDPPASN